MEEVNRSDSAVLRFHSSAASSASQLELPDRIQLADGEGLDRIAGAFELDGSGYPLGLRGGELTLTARILAVADVFEAMTPPGPIRGPSRPRSRSASWRRPPGRSTTTGAPLQCVSSCTPVSHSPSFAR